VRLDTRRKEILPDNSGIRVKVKVVKNKVAAPFKAVMLDVLFGSGIDRMGCTLDAAIDLGIMERKGSWYAYKGNNISQGRQNAVELLKKDAELAATIETEVRLALASFGLSDDKSVDTENDAVVDELLTVESTEESFLE
jgi:recombination protein RecA